MGGGAFWFAGLSGTGKTTLARIVAGMIARCQGIEEVKSVHTTLEYVPRWEHEGTVLAPADRPDPTLRALILNDALLMRKLIVSRLLTTLDPVPRHAVYCFTTTIAGQDALFEGCIDAHPLLSRCAVIELETA